MWKFKFIPGLLLLFCSVLEASKCPNVPQGTAKLVCYYEGKKSVEDLDPCGCTHLVYMGESRGDALAEISKKLLEKKPKLKILLRVNGKDKDISELMKSSVIHGVDLYEAHNALNRTRIIKSTESIRSTIGSDAILMMSLPPQSELLAKYYDLKNLIKIVTLFAVDTHHLGEIENETYHPSRLSGIWDMMNTDSVVDLVIGLGVPSSKLIITSPANGFKFTLKNSTLSTPGSPATEKKPIYLDQKALCAELNNGEKWTLERDQDLSAPYAFKNDKWLAFEDISSLDVKGKYTRIRGLAGMGLFKIDDDAETKCGASLLQSIVKGLGSQSRAPRGAVLSSLENEILSVPHSNRLVDGVQVSPYRISRVVDSDGVIHAIREDTRTEFKCQRQGYFVHPRSCNRFYRCVKFNQLSDEFTVFEFDCPAGLAFDARWEVCVWPGSLSEGQACPGSSEIAPVPETRFICPEKPGYYADPANCRWFFACLDHGKSPLSAYEFRCPFGLGFDESKLICDWPWLVPGCGNLGKYEASAYGHGSSVLTGASSYIGLSADSVNVAAHNSLISGASSDNLVGIQSGYGSYHNGANEAYEAGSYNTADFSGGASGELSGGAYNGINSNQYNNIGHQNSASGNLYSSNNFGSQSSASFIANSQLSSNNFGNYHGGESAAVQKEYGALSSGGSNNNRYSSSGFVSENSGSLLNDGVSGVKISQNYFGIKGSDGDNGYNNNRYSSSGFVSENGGSLLNHGSSGVKISQNYFGIKGSDSDNGNKNNGHSSSGFVSENGGSLLNHGSSGVKVSQNYFGIKGSNGDNGNNNNRYSSSGFESGNGGSLFNHGSSGIKISQNSYNGKGSGVYFGNSNEAGDINSGAYYHDASGDYRHDYSGEYNHDNTGEYHESSVPYQHIDIGAIKYSGLYGSGSLGSNIQYKDLSAGSYLHDSSGEYRHENSGAYKEDSSSGILYNYGNSGATNSAYQFDCSYYKQNSGSNGNSFVGNSNGNLKSQNSVSINHVSSNAYTPVVSSYNGGAGYAATGAAHTLTAGAINAGLVGKTILIDTGSLVEGQYQNYANSGSNIKSNSGSAYSTQTYTPIKATYNQENFVSHANLGYGSSASKINTGSNYDFQAHVTPTTFAYKSPDDGSYSANYNGQYSGNSQSSYSFAPVVKYQQPVYVTPSPQPAVYKAAVVLSQPKTAIKQIFGVQSAQISHVQPIVSVTSTPKPYNYENTVVEVQRQPLVAITNYNSPTVSTQNSYQRVTGTPISITQAPIISYSQNYVSSTPRISPISYKKPVVTEYKNPLIIKNVTPIPTVSSVPAFVQQPTYATYLHQPTTSTFVKPAFASYKSEDSKYNAGAVFNQQNTVVHTQPIVSDNIQTVYTQQKYVQQPINEQKYVNIPEIKYTAGQQSYQHISQNQYVSPVLYSTPIPEIKHQGYTYKAPEYLPPKTEYREQENKNYNYQSTVHAYDASKFKNQDFSSVSYQQPIQLVNKVEQQQFVYKQPQVYSKPSFVSSTPSSIKYEHQSNIQHAYDLSIPVPIVSSTPVSVAYKQPVNIHYNVQPAVISSTPAIVHFERAFNYKIPKTNTVQTFDYSPTVHISTPAPLVYQKPAKPSQIVESFHISSNTNSDYNRFASSSSQTFENEANKYAQVNTYQVPITYQSSTYSPPKVSTYRPSVTYHSTLSQPKVSTYKPPVTYQSSTYLPPKINTFESAKTYQSSTYLPPKIDNSFNTYQGSTTYQSSSYSPPRAKYVSSTPIVTYESSSQAPIRSSTYKGPDYLPPLSGIKTTYDEPEINFNYKTVTQRPLKLVSSTPSVPVYQQAISYNTNPIQEFVFNKVPTTPISLVAYKKPAVLPQQKYAQIPEISSTPNIIYQNPTPTVNYNQQPINLLGFGTVGPDAGLVSSPFYSSTQGTVIKQKIIPVTQRVVPTYQNIVEVTPPTVRKSRPKIAIVTKVNDFNPLLVRKLGAVCSCRSNVLHLRKPRPQQKQESEYEIEYENDYDVPINGENDDEWTYKSYKSTASSSPYDSALPTSSSHLLSKSTTPIIIEKPKLTVFSSTFKPIVVPDDSYNYEDDSNYKPIVKSTFQPIVVSDNDDYTQAKAEQFTNTDKPLRGRPLHVRTKVRPVTIAPTIASVLIPESQSLIEHQQNNGEVRAFDRYGPGGWRSIDETLQGTIDCQRVGLFRHPKHCNKFYSCRWDCTKKRFTLHVFNCPVQLSFDPSMGACNWPSQGPACQSDTLLPSGF